MTKEKGVKYGIVGDSEACKIVKGEETLPAAIKPPVIREELPTIPSGYEILQEHLNTMNAILERVFEELRLIRTGELPTPEGIPGEGMYYVTDEVAIQVATPNPPPGQVIDSDRIVFDTLTSTLGPASNGYQRERIHDVIKRNAPRATVINDGSATVYVISSPNGRKWSPATPILPYEARTFFNVWELRLRSSVKGNLTATPFTGGVYRITEFDYWLAYSRIVTVTGAPVTLNVNLAPVALASLTSAVQPASGVAIIGGGGLTPVSTPTSIKVEVAMSNSGQFFAIINGVSTLLNANVLPPALVVNGLYVFEIALNAGDTIDFSYVYAGPAGTIQILRVQEIDSAIA